ncbi:TPA: hypothetical protein JLF73_003734 [Escherichia coli]|nr:hypothetical protein [Escherichia coli]
MNQLKIVVDLFRKSKTPHFDGVKFSASIDYTTDIKMLLTTMLDDNFNEGSFDEIEIDGCEIYDGNDLPNSGTTLTYSFKVARRSAERFYASKREFIEINTLRKGVMPKNYYIAESDFYSYDAQKPDYIMTIEKICQLISCLSNIAHFHDTKSDRNTSFYRLVFVLHSESKSTTAVIETNLTEEVLDIEDLNINLIANLSKSDASKDNHYLEKLNTFRNTLIEYISKTNGSFINIIKNWNDINELYSNNLAVYMSAFSFHKTRKEIADAEIDYADKISKVVSEIANKALAIPVSLVAAISIFQMTGELVSIVAFLGILLTSIITYLVAVSQKRQLERIIHAKDTLFDTMMNRLSEEQNELKLRLQIAQIELNKNEVFCIRVLDLMRCLSWMPTCVGILALLINDVLI